MIELAVSKFVKILEEGEKRGASDIHLIHGRNPVLRIHGELEEYLDVGKCSSIEIKNMVSWNLDENQILQLKEEKQLDFSFAYGKDLRYRCNLHKERGNYSLVLRVIKNSVPSLKNLLLPEIVKDFKKYKNGLVLVTGPTGSGKSTTLTALINEINEKEARSIITIEDPIEYIYENKLSIVRQREVGSDMKSFAHALKSILRQDPDIILLGELRDSESIEAALIAAETGHLVFATLHTSGAVETIDRIVDVFPSEKQRQIRGNLANNLRAVVSQKLIKSTTGRVCATEILINNSNIRNLINNNKGMQIYGAMELSRKEGMRTMRNSLDELFKERYISANTYQDEIRDVK